MIINDKRELEKKYNTLEVKYMTLLENSYETVLDTLKNIIKYEEIKEENKILRKEIKELKKRKK